MHYLMNTLSLFSNSVLEGYRKIVHRVIANFIFANRYYSNTMIYGYVVVNRYNQEVQYCGHFILKSGSWSEMEHGCRMA